MFGQGLTSGGANPRNSINAVRNFSAGAIGSLPAVEGHTPDSEPLPRCLLAQAEFEPTVAQLIPEAARRPGCPDCAAKRQVDARRDRWHRARIEFEYFSSSFRDHGHDPAGCDVIVCWENDRPDCPLEVVELRRVIEQLPTRPE